MRSKSPALGGVLLWLLGTVVLPDLHLARHERPHDHEGGGIHYHLDEEAGEAHAEHNHDDDDDEPGGPFTVEAPHHHGHSHHDAGLAHFAASTGEGATPTPILTSTADPERVPDALSSRSVGFFLEGKKAARAPPAA